MHGMPDMTSNDQDDSLRKAERDLIAITDQLEINLFQFTQIGGHDHQDALEMFVCFFILFTL